MISNANNTGSEAETRLYPKQPTSGQSTANFAVIQSLADIQPDVDAIYRLVRGTPFSFIRPEPMIAPSVQQCKYCEHTKNNSKHFIAYN